MRTVSPGYFPALGAQDGAIRRHVMRKGMRPVALGLVPGILMSARGTRTRWSFFRIEGEADVMMRRAFSLAGGVLALGVFPLAGAFGAQGEPPSEAYREAVQGWISDGPSRQSLETRFQETLDALRREFGFPGATAAFILPHGTVGTAATGFADLEARDPMSPGSRMLMASIGKSFVAAAVLDLAMEGTLGLRDPLARWLGDRSWFSRLPNHESLTLDHLLRHSGGLPDHVFTEAFAEAWQQRWAQEAPAFSPETLVEFILDQPPLFRPGEGWAYTDTGYILLGLAVEEASGRPLFDLILNRFLVPLELGLTTPSDRRILPGLAAGYLPPDNPFGLPRKTTLAPGVMAWDPGVEWAGGGLAGNPADLVVWARELYEGRAMEGDYLPELLRSVPVDPDNPQVRYGAGVAIYTQGPLGPVWGHAGQIPGYVSSMRYYPDLGVAVAFQINGDGGIAGEESGGEFVPEMERRLAEVVAEGTSGGGK